MALVITVEDNNIPKVAKIPLQPKAALLATAEIYTSKTWQYLVVPKNRISKEESVGVHYCIQKQP